MNQQIGNISNSFLENVNNSSIHSENISRQSNFLEYANRFLFVANIILLIVNVFYTCNNYPNSKDLGFDYSGIIVGILSILITILVGWQILSNLLAKKEIREDVDMQISRMNKQNELSLAKLDKNIEISKKLAIGASLAQLGVSQLYSDDYSNAIRSLFNSLAFCDKDLSFDELGNEVYEQSIHALKK